MTTREKNVGRARAAGYEMIDTHVLSAQSRDDYYAPIARAIEDGRVARLGSDFAARLVDEWAVFKKSNGSFGYVFYIVKSKPMEPRVAQHDASRSRSRSYRPEVRR